MAKKSSKMQYNIMNKDSFLFVVIWCTYAGLVVVGVPIVDLGTVVGVVDIFTNVVVVVVFTITNLLRY